MYIPDQPQNVSFPWATATSACEQRGCPVTDAANLKKRKRDMGNWDGQINANIGTCTAFIPGNAQHIEDRFRNGYSQFLKDSSSGAIASKFALRPSPERRTHHSRPSWQPAAIKRRRLIQHQQNQQSQQEWNTIPRNIYLGQKQHFYTPDSESSSPTLALKSSTPSPPFQKAKSNTHNNNYDDDPSISSVSQINNKTTSHTSLSPCHICHRRPTTRSTLDAYADCDLCAERTCYICLRECMVVDCNGPRSPSNPGPGCGKDNNHNNNDGGGGGKASEWRRKTSPPNSRPGHGDEGAEENGERMGRKVCSWCAVESVLDGGGEFVRCFACVAGW
ncbi:hypothetical protein BDDG_01301 [Blastomyces dermatitidis ATCC 18188]|uniref:Uncharacterized protein n=1 Tax=Ajellomyces dermatitidis (strain ATCC 18188 / CBS 674.68) TaxID=653446 RepID=F2T5D9_AJEDA|nr:hypothetical protein BDDG_01301 [Blastomyces dermatitidis ATCC 18188]